MIIEAKDFAGPKVQGRYHFGGAQRAQNIAALEKLTQAVRDGRVLLQKVTVSAAVSLEDWLFTTLSLTYAEQDEPFLEPKEPEEQAGREVKELYGPGQFTVELR